MHGLISELKVERGVVRDTMLELESLTEHTPPPRPPSTTHARKLDLETAVLMQVHTTYSLSLENHAKFKSVYNRYEFSVGFI